MFTRTARSLKTRSGLDYSKMVIIQNTEYFDSTTAAIVDQDEYTEMMQKLPTIVKEVNDYVNTYISHMNGTIPLHPKAFLRKYQYSTLAYFHDLLKI